MVGVRWELEQGGLRKGVEVWGGGKMVLVGKWERGGVEWGRMVVWGLWMGGRMGLVMGGGGEGRLE